MVSSQNTVKLAPFALRFEVDLTRIFSYSDGDRINKFVKRWLYARIKVYTYN